jgi:hypothetical protein
LSGGVHSEILDPWAFRKTFRNRFNIQYSMDSFHHFSALTRLGWTKLWFDREEPFKIGRKPDFISSSSSFSSGRGKAKCQTDNAGERK